LQHLAELNDFFALGNDDIPRYEAVQQQWNERDCPDGVMGKLQRWMTNSPN